VLLCPKDLKPMEYRRLGNSGLQVSSLSFGSWITFGNQVEQNIAKECMYHAFDHGVNFFDNAEVYAHGKSEEVMGKLLADAGWSRDQYIVSSKVFWGGDKPNQTGLSRKHVVEACHAALKRLRVDYLDLYFCHRPDKQTPMEETVWAMHNLITQGKVLYWGTSEWSAQEVQEAMMVAKANHLIGPTMEQPKYNMLVRKKVEVEFFKLFRDYGYGTTIWSPLASGILTGKYNNGVPTEARLNREELAWLKERILTDANIAKVKALMILAEELGTTVSNLAIAWCLKNQYVSTVITGATKLEQLKQNLSALNDVEKLTPEVMEAIELILQNKPEMPAY
jgi:voltage-dependent potassium channel beta subunit